MSSVPSPAAASSNAPNHQNMTTSSSPLGNAASTTTTTGTPASSTRKPLRHYQRYHNKTAAALTAAKSNAPLRPNIQLLSQQIISVRDDYIEKPNVLGAGAAASGGSSSSSSAAGSGSAINDSSAGGAGSGRNRRNGGDGNTGKNASNPDALGAPSFQNSDLLDPSNLLDSSQQLSFETRNAWKKDLDKDPSVALGLLTSDLVKQKKILSQWRRRENRNAATVATTTSPEEESDSITHDAFSELHESSQANIPAILYDIDMQDITAKMNGFDPSVHHGRPNEDPSFIRNIHTRKRHCFSHEVYTFRLDEYYEAKFKRHSAVPGELTEQDVAPSPSPVGPSSGTPTADAARGAASRPASTTSNLNQQRYLQESLVPLDNDLSAEQLLMCKYENILFLSSNFTIFALYCNPVVGKQSKHLQILDSFTFPKEKFSKRLFRSIKHTKKINEFVTNIKASLPAGNTLEKWKIIQDMQVQASERRLIVLFGDTLHAIDFNSICSKIKKGKYNCHGSLKCYRIQGKKSSNVEMMSINKKNDKYIVVKNAQDNKYFQLELIGSSYVQVGKTLELFVPGTILAIEYVDDYIVLSLSSQYLIVRSDGLTLLNSLKRQKFNFRKWPRYLEDGSQVFSHLIPIIGPDKTVYTTAGMDDPNPPNPPLLGPDWFTTQVMDFFYPFVVNVQQNKVEYYSIYHDKRVDFIDFSDGYASLHDEKNLYTIARKNANVHQLLISSPVSFYEQKKNLLMNMDFLHQGSSETWPEGPLDRIREHETLDLHKYHSDLLHAELEEKFSHNMERAIKAHRALMNSIENDAQLADKPEALQRALDSAQTQHKMELDQITDDFSQKKSNLEMQMQWQLSQIQLLHGVLCLHQAKFLSQKKMSKSISEAFEHFKHSTIDIRFLRNYMQKAGEDQELTKNLNSLKILSEIHPERMFLKPEQYDYLIEDKKYYAILRTSSYLPPVSGYASFPAVQEFISFLERRKVMYANDPSYLVRKLYAQDQLALDEVNIYLKPHQLVELMHHYEKKLEEISLMRTPDEDLSWFEDIIIYPTNKGTDDGSNQDNDSVKEAKFGRQWVDLYLILHHGSQMYHELQPTEREIKRHIHILQGLNTLRPDDPSVDSQAKQAYVALRMSEHAHYLFGYLKLKFGKKKASFFNRVAILLEKYRRVVAQSVLSDETYSIDNYLLLLYGMLQHSNHISPETRIKYSKQLKKITRGEEWNHWLLHVWGKLAQVETAKSIDIRISAIRSIFSIPKIYITWRITELTKENLNLNTEEDLENYLMESHKTRDRWIEEIEDCLANHWEIPVPEEPDPKRKLAVVQYDYFVDTESRFQDKSRKDVIIDACVDMLSRSHCILKRQILEIITSLIQKICRSKRSNVVDKERDELLEEAIAQNDGQAESAATQSPMLFTGTDIPVPDFQELQETLAEQKRQEHDINANSTTGAVTSPTQEPSHSPSSANAGGVSSPGSYAASRGGSSSGESIREHISSLISQRKLMLPLIRIFIHQHSKFTIGEVLRFLRNTHKLPYTFFSNNHSYHMQIEYLEMIFADKHLLENLGSDFVENYHSVEYQLAQLYVIILGKFVVSGDKKNELIERYRTRFHSLVTSESFNYKLDAAKKRELLKTLEPFRENASGSSSNSSNAGLKEELIILHSSLRNHREVLRIMFSGVTERTQYPEAFDQAESYCIRTFEQEKQRSGSAAATASSSLAQHRAMAASAKNDPNPYFTHLIEVACSLIERQNPEDEADYKRYILNLLTRRAREISLLDCLDYLPGDWSAGDLSFILKRNLRLCQEKIRTNQIRERTLSRTKLQKEFELSHLQSRYVIIDKDKECARSNPRESINDVYGESLFIYPSSDIKKHCQQVVKGKNILNWYGNAFERHINPVNLRDLRKNPTRVKQLVKDNLIEHPKQLT